MPASRSSSTKSTDPRTVAQQAFVAVGVAVTTVIALYLIWLLREPIGWTLLAIFVAVALSGPVSFLARHMKRGFAILLVFLVLVLVPVGLAAIVVPPVVGGAADLVEKAPEYATQTQQYIQENDKLQGIDAKYHLSDKLTDAAAEVPKKLPDAAGTLADVGSSVAGSVAALATIIVMAIFMLAGGARWVDWAVRQQPPERARRIRRVLDASTRAIGSYLLGAISIATLAGVLSFIVMSIIGVPFAAPLAVAVGLFSLLPMIGATIAAVIVGVVTLFVDFPTTTILWVVWAVLYQQLENTLIQPQVQKRSVNLHPLLVIIAVLCGSTLLGVLGAILAIPMAATIQIVVKEWWNHRPTRSRRAATS